MADSGDMRLSLFYGLLFGCILFGTAIGQSAWYFTVYKKDSDWLMLLVGMVLILNLAQSILLSFATYYSTLSWLYPSSLNMITWSLPSSLAVTYVLTFTVQCFFLGRIWMMSQKNKMLTPVIAILIVLQLAFGMSAFATLKIDYFPTTGSDILPTGSKIPVLDITSKTKLTMSVQTASSLAADLVITISLVYYINRRRFTGNSSWTSNSILNRLLVISISTGLLTSLITLANLVLFHTMSNSYYWLIPQALSSKLYVNSLFATLNSRRSVQELFQRNSQLFPTPPPILSPRPSNAMLYSEHESRGREMNTDHAGDLLTSVAFVERNDAGAECGETKEGLNTLNGAQSLHGCYSLSGTSAMPHTRRAFREPDSRNESTSRPILTSNPESDDTAFEIPPKIPWSSSPASNLWTPVSGHSIHSSRLSMQYVSDSDNITGISSSAPITMPPLTTKRMTNRSAGSVSTRASPRLNRISSKSTRSKKSAKSNRSVPQIGSLNFPSEIRLTLESRASSSASVLTNGGSPIRCGGAEFF